MSTSFEVVSLAGEVLASCSSYVAAWIPANVPFAPDERRYPTSLLRTVWSTEGLAALDTCQFDRIVYVGSSIGIRDGLETWATTVGIGFSATTLPPHIKGESSPHLSILQTHVFNGDDRHSDVVIFDACLPDGDFASSSVTDYSNTALEFTKHIASTLHSKLPFSVVILTRNALPILAGDIEGGVVAGEPTAVHSLHLAGSLIQGMVRVLRTECGLENVWGLDTPSLSSSTIVELVYKEVSNLGRTARSPVAYRYSANESLVRLVPTLRKDEQPNRGIFNLVDGVSVIVGMGDIGIALAGEIINSGGSGVVFVGRREVDNVKVASALESLRGAHPAATFQYFSADVTSYESLKRTMTLATETQGLGAINTIVLTAGIVKDSIIKNTSTSSLEEVLGPKVWGAWNLHLVCEHMKLNVNRFVMFSSVSVPLGNAGQVSYVAANSLLDALAAFRNSIYPRSRSVSLQLGPWQSRLIEGMTFGEGPVVPTDHAEGLPLLLKAMDGLRSVQVVAAFCPDRMQGIPTYARDPYFKELAGPDASEHRTTGHLQLTRRGIEEELCRITKTLVEMGENSTLDIGESFAALGLDSIAFTQLRGAMMKTFNVNVPMSYMGDEYSLRDVADHITQLKGL